MAAATVVLGGRPVGFGCPCYIVAEIGQNHNGSVDLALDMIHAAHRAGADAVKFQKREPELCVPEARRNDPKETPWGVMTYLEYRHRLELGRAEYDRIHALCTKLSIGWTASVWDLPSLEFLLRYDPPWIKVASACLTDLELLGACRRSGRAIVASTGMSTLEQIDRAVAILGPDRLVLLACTSTYPCPPEELQLGTIRTLGERFAVPIGFSDHSTGIWAPLAAAALGACLIEKHFTHSRSAWGSDQAASVEPDGLTRIIRYIRRFESAMGDGVKRILDSERPPMARLRRVP